VEPSIYHKNMMRSHYITADVAGSSRPGLTPSSSWARGLKDFAAPGRGGGGYAIEQYTARQPSTICATP